MSTSRSYHHGDLRAALLETTRGLVAEVGIEGLSLREVSRRAGVSHAAAYNHFRDKASLVRAIVDAAFARLADEMRRARESGSDPFTSLERMGVAYIRFAFCNRADFKIMFRPELCGVNAARHERETDDAYAQLVAAVEACRKAGAIGPESDRTLVMAAWSMVHGLASLIVDGPGSDIAPTVDAAEALADRCVRMLVQGMRTRTGPVRRSSAAARSGLS